MEVKEVRRKVAEESEEKTWEKKTVYGTPEEMKRRAEDGYFVCDPEKNLVYCPAGEILRKKCLKKNGNIRMPTKTHAGTVRTGINVIKGKMNGRRSILQRTVWRSPAETGWSWRERHVISNKRALRKKESGDFYIKAG